MRFLGWPLLIVIVGVYVWWQYGDLEDRLPTWANWVLVVVGLILAGAAVYAFGIGPCDMERC